MLKNKIALLLIFLIALLLRLLFITSAHHGDLNNNISWGQIAAEKGLNGFYGSDNSDDWPFSAPNQPPLYVLLFAVLMKLWLLIRDFIFYLNWELLIFPSSLVWFWDDKGMDVMAKLPGIFADLGIGLLIYKYLKVQSTKFEFQSWNYPLIITTLWLFNPVVWYNSAVWGQTDSIVNLLGLIAVFALLERKLEKFAVFFTLSILYKGSLAIFVPVFLFIIFIQKYPLKRFFPASLYSLIALILVSIWFHPYLDYPLWFIDLYQRRILPGEIGYLTANAFNFWWLVDSGKTNDSISYFGVPARIIGLVVSLLGISAIIYWLKKRIADGRVFASLMVSALVTFLFMTRIHERYLYPYFPYATLFLAFSPSYLPLYIAISLIHLTNLYHLFWVPSFPPLESLYLNPLFAYLLSVISIVILLLTFRHLRSAKI